MIARLPDSFLRPTALGEGMIQSQHEDVLGEAKRADAQPAYKSRTTVFIPSRVIAV